MLCYQFSINPPHNRRARAPVLILPDSEPLPSTNGRGLNAVLCKGSLNTEPQKKKVTTQKDEVKKKKDRKSLPVSFIPSKDKKMGKAQRMHLFSDSGERQEDAARQGDQFSPLRACVVSKAKCRKIGGVEGRNSFILISERGLNGRDGSDLSIFTTKAEAGLNSCWIQSERRM